MSRKQNILNKIKSINDPGLLQRLEQWLDEVCETRTGVVNEESQIYKTRPTVSNNKNTQDTGGGALKWLKKIADEGGVSAIEDPVEWQKKERRDRSLPIQ